MTVPDVDWSRDEDLNDYDSTKLDQVWMFLWEHLTETGRVIAYDLKRENAFDDLPYTENVIYSDLLPKMRPLLAEAGHIDVREEKSDRFDSVKKVWVLPGDDV